MTNILSKKQDKPKPNRKLSVEIDPVSTTYKVLISHYD